MKMPEIVKPLMPQDNREDFNWGATIGVLVLMLAFVGATFYVLISSLKDLS